MNPELNSQEWHRLFTAKADGTITPEEHERLAALLKESAEARREWFAFQDAEAALLAWSQREALRRDEGVDVTLPKTELAGAHSSRNGWLRYAGTLAAGIVIGLAAWALWPKASLNSGNNRIAARDEATTSSVAMLSRGVNLEWDKSVGVPALNAPLPPGLLRLKSGVAEIEFFQGARLCIEGPAEIRLLSAGAAYCQYGKFSAHVPPPARGFRLSTPKGDIVDLGTDFGLDLNDKSPELHVFKGEVELHQPKVEMRKLTTGTGAGLENPGANRMLVANAAAFVFSHDLDARVIASRREAFDQWQQLNEQRNADPDLRVHLDFQDPDGARSLHNAALHGEDIATGTIVGCNWTEGRWPGKRALQFHSVSDRVRVKLPGEYRQFTIAAWVQLHSLNARQDQSSICMSQGLDVGDVHWQVIHTGAICLGIVAEAHPHVTDDYISPVVFTPDRFGQWVHLAATFDIAAKEVRFYVNGELLSRHTLKRPIVPKPAVAELGNWLPASDYAGSHPVRNFVGCMDDFSFYARALSADEVRQLAQ
ncbi:LamG domain protein jellyroll fold domain protein [Chthoniobacter flavus Ellin428]|uniref:LamG domain protein jellyroll fold domain protein n=1 Tax=Chthoniobacter flavus Ellin428 TaxID=497964 RepID=B4D1M2_9BACT|nr:LamG-like jellyroll fold domain-containing protein [Chthoniobacter flavus]EDY19634.1 LamG domain protein jellyroll fold domain protein [Chthoniobacter flavus Ellin428]TCO92871.1 FecR family protein [Chthoniobacter flavus]